MPEVSADTDPDSARQFQQILAQLPLVTHHVQDQHLRAMMTVKDPAEAAQQLAVYGARQLGGFPAGLRELLQSS